MYFKPKSNLPTQSILAPYLKNFKGLGDFDVNHLRHWWDVSPPRVREQDMGGRRERKLTCH